ncbi:hypothetical protein IscW_ISCW021990 [Ixodes scapularis]|uniref:Uncharacterized protein n=1 Tax=Ixodes scapularis TaxID=6945 RepID=B7QFZ6_IXOSC|nr:hypothetical protein IscW_ISCW021990 [Ixodes scapularis]|eukprot:XP_002401059.1 hypothetical protein IscW_ISCW021990 [Ixodes scapularis]
MAWNEGYALKHRYPSPEYSTTDAQGMILYSFSMCFMVFLVTGLVAFSIKVKNAGLEPGCGLRRGPISSTSTEDATLTWRWEKPT